MSAIYPTSSRRQYPYSGTGKWYIVGNPRLTRNFTDYWQCVDKRDDEHYRNVLRSSYALAVFHFILCVWYSVAL
ncbi:hypothetical protein PISMIDRAFT_205500 [Pisolithus microcarpus 441]|uniref:Uncharacterized protein n=1 Tax=Pisolithus microcarpus 441 TaxID=765257 RepID=A0A0C9ZDB1_9AGAM|nr:hypothetical protein PISMIDRAFT_205500 [Pisolithus microcarpus 441]